jgi:hypothetical protein
MFKTYHFNFFLTQKKTAHMLCNPHSPHFNYRFSTGTPQRHETSQHRQPPTQATAAATAAMAAAAMAAAAAAAASQTFAIQAAAAYPAHEIAKSRHRMDCAPETAAASSTSSTTSLWEQPPPYQKPTPDTPCSGQRACLLESGF